MNLCVRASLSILIIIIIEKVKLRKIQDTRCGIKDARYKIQDAG